MVQTVDQQNTWDALNNWFQSGVSSSLPGGSGGPSSIYNLWNYYQQLAQNQYQWGQQQFAKDSNLTDQVVNDELAKANELTGMGTRDLSRYQGIYQPLEDQLVAQAKSYAGAPRIAAEMGRAGATAARTAEQGRQNALADLRAAGIDPSAGRYASLNNAERLAQAASVTGAENTAREQTEATGRGLQAQAIQVGELYPRQIATEIGTALTADQGAMQARLANAASGLQLMGSPTQWAQDTTGAANIQLQKYLHPMGGATVNWPSAVGDKGGGGGGGSSGYGGRGGGGYGGGGGGGGGASYDDAGGYGGDGGVDLGGGEGGGDGGGSYYGDTGDTSVGSYGGDYGGDYSAQAGGAIDMGGMPPPSPMGPTTGGQVGMQASPSAGAIPDDVPARLSAHEYVIPRDVALWKGREHFQRLIDKARQDMTGATAKPQMKPALNQRPTFRSRPMGAAIPGAM